MTTQQIRVIACKCPQCGQELKGIHHDRILFCWSCNIGIDLYVNPIKIYPVQYAKSNQNRESSQIFLPIWRFEIAMSFTSEDSDKLSKLQQIPLLHVYIRGFRMHGLILFGDINRMLTAVQPKMEIENKTYPVLGCRKSAEMAAECINITALSIIDKFVDITGVTLTFKIISTSLLAVPFHLENTGLVDGLMGYEYCHVAFDDLPAIKSALHSNTA